MTTLIRHRLLYILLLGVATSALSLVVLMRALTFSEAQRLERAREVALGELDRLVAVEPSNETLATPRASYLGLRGGWISGPEDIGQMQSLPSSWAPTLRRAVNESALAVRAGNSPRVLIGMPFGQSHLVIACAPSVGGRTAWVGVMMAPSTYLRPYRYYAVAIALATALLFTISLTSILSFRRQARALESTLLALGKDLEAPVPRPSLAELSPLADGIERLAKDLRDSREATNRLARELTQQDRLAALGRVAAGVAHEVRNPLAAIKLRLDLTAAAHALPEGARAAVDSASQEIARLDRLVSDLLIVAGKQPGPRRAVELGALLRDRAEHLAPWAEERGVALVITAGDASTEADPESLSRAIDNLLRNAVEASPRGQAVLARVEAHAGEVEVVVEDGGAGVEPTRAAELFEPFFTTKPEGTGLGLALSRAIARTHGGEITYARASGRTCFRMSLSRGVQAAS
jgi:signal transduction histidine kinase